MQIHHSGTHPPSIFKKILLAKLGYVFKGGGSYVKQSIFLNVNWSW